MYILLRFSQHRYSVHIKSGVFLKGELYLPFFQAQTAELLPYIVNGELILIASLVFIGGFSEQVYA
jgi:hypothetical protein